MPLFLCFVFGIMRIRDIHIEGYRSLAEVDMHIGEETQILCIVGNNGLGKTNLLEALYTMSISKPFRGKRMQEIVKDNAETFQVQLGFQDEGSDRKVALFGQHRPFEKQFHLDGRAVSPSEIVGEVKMVLFHPGDIGEFASSPAYRRRYLNVLISQVDHSYTRDLIEYTKVLKQRNKLLRIIRMGEGERKELAYWDEQIALLGARIGQKRIDALSFINGQLKETYDTLAGGNNKISCSYETPHIFKDGYTEEHILEELLLKQESDIAYLSTSVGPHRDDLSMKLGGKDVFRFASRGELRSLVLSLKLIEIAFIEGRTGKTPILLLDDVFSELDITRQEHLLEMVSHVQTLMTVTHTEPLDVGRGDVQIVQIEELLGN